MRRHVILSAAGAILGVAMLWGVSGMPGYSFGQSKAGSGPARPANPCNPCTPKGRGNPCRPNPCNPCKPNPCNPCKPRGAAACNPCAPKGAKLSWGAGYPCFPRTTGYVLSATHGNRLVVTYVSPKAAVEVYQHNARLVREKRTSGYRNFPAGTVLVKESYERAGATAGGGPCNPCSPKAAACNPCAPKANPCNPCAPKAKPCNPCAPRGPLGHLGIQQGPVFFMKKEPAGYDRAGGNWRYAVTDTDLRITVGEGNTGPVAFCKACHTAVKGRDFVYAVDR